MVEQIPAPIPSVLQYQSLASPAIPEPTTTSADFSLRLAPLPFQAQGEISPGKNAFLHCTTAGFTPPRIDHKSFVDACPLAQLGTASYPVLVHRLAVSLHASSPRSVALTQLRFTSLTVVSLRRDLHPQECAHAGRTNKKPPTLRRTAFATAAWRRCQQAGKRINASRTALRDVLYAGRLSYARLHGRHG